MARRLTARPTSVIADGGVDPHRRHQLLDQCRRRTFRTAVVHAPRVVAALEFAPRGSRGSTTSQVSTSSQEAFASASLRSKTGPTLST